MGVVNVAGPGRITVDGQAYPMQKLDGLYIGMGSHEVCFESDDPGQPAHFYFSSTPAHARYPTAHIPINQAAPQRLGDLAHSNERTIYK
jgi:4-deoxy-L-threo-5-hexosulose-uronate ketol-isomerase